MANHSLYCIWLMNDLTERKKISLASILSSIEDSGIQEVKRLPQYSLFLLIFASVHMFDSSISCILVATLWLLYYSSFFLGYFILTILLILLSSSILSSTVIFFSYFCFTAFLPPCYISSSQHHLVTFSVLHVIQ